VTFSFGSPTRREEAAGFWTWPTVIKVGGVEVGRIVPAEKFGEFTVEGAIKLLDSAATSGHHGGFWSLKIAAPEGATIERERPEPS
jgi:hypothetical protein